MNYAPARKSEVTSLEFVEFNSSVTLSQQDAILGKVAKEIGKVYEKSGDETLAQLAQSYYTMEEEAKHLSKLVEKQLQIYNRKILSSRATLMDFTRAQSCGMICGPFGVPICGAICALLATTGIGFIICMGGCLALWGAFCTWACNSLCGQPTTIQQLGCGAVCRNICALCPSYLQPTCLLCGTACGQICMELIETLPPQPPASDEIRRTSGTLSGTGATYTFSVSNLWGTYTVVMVGNEQADFDLYAKWGSAPTTSNYDARGFSGYSSEYFTVSGSGTLYVMVRSWYGSGQYSMLALIF